MDPIRSGTRACTWHVTYMSNLKIGRKKKKKNLRGEGSYFVLRASDFTLNNF